MTNIIPEVWEQAKKLASRNYEVEIAEDVLTNGQAIYLVKTPELRGCMAQGETLEEALRELALARMNYIYYKLIDDRPIPPPRVDHTITSSSTDVTPSAFKLTGMPESGGTFIMHQFDDFPNTVVQPETHEKLANVSVIEGDFEQQEPT